MEKVSEMRICALTTIAMLALTVPAGADIATIDGHDIYYELHGDLVPDRAPLLVLHGGAMHVGSTFGAVLPALAEHHAVIGVEQQGHGHSPINDQPITLDSMRRDTLGVLDALGVSRAHVIGFSAGGMLGLDLAVNAPDRVASLTAISAAQNLDGFLPELAALNRDPAAGLSPDVAALMPSAEEFARMRGDVARMNPGGAKAADQMFAKMGAFIGSDWGWTDEQIAGITAPVMIMQGDTDFIRRDHATHLAGTIPGAWLAILPDSTHLSIMSNPALPAMLLHRIDSAGQE